ncbi:Hypothetical predicted protein [Mytilus galloprovincialis]|uniref:Fibrinogen C-terminal domain-containing protein n=1 Tax=Mytilus galloprovincialis TaxID=29158 RepID=A0A8B6GXJ6_MYTGA|nr:Hypothetical predicted protein [Mytilus galloprovincialis]
MPSIAACASVCSSDQQCCSSSYDTSTRFCTLDTCSTPETETTDHTKVIVKNPDSIGNLQPRDCSDLPPCTKSGVFTIYPDESNTMTVYCDMCTSGGGWTVIQRRIDDSVDFYKYWNDYKSGFGNVSGNHWLGNDNLHIMTRARNYVIRFELKDFADNTAYAEYQSFHVANEASNYKVTFSTYTGTAGNAFAQSNGMEFTSRENERDNDFHIYHCGKGRLGPWWFNACGKSSLNGPYKRVPSTKEDAKVIHWATWRGYIALKATEMKIKTLE